jgi:hypothetical protein
MRRSGPRVERSAASSSSVVNESGAKTLKSPESPTQLGFNPQAVRLQVAPPPVANGPGASGTNQVIRVD